MFSRRAERPRPQNATVDMYERSKSASSSSSTASSWQHFGHQDVPQTPNKEVEFMPKPPGGALLISPFGYKNGLRDASSDIESFTPSSEGSFEDERGQERPDALAVEEERERFAKPASESSDSAESEIENNDRAHRGHNILRECVIASCQALIMAGCFKTLTVAPTSAPTLQSLAANVVGYLAAVTVTSGLLGAENIAEGGGDLHTAASRVGKLLALPLTSSLYQMGRLVGFLGRNFVEGVKDGYLT
ncbi:uncharacterized protein EI97DRAFT_462924 [Westerdykella ornata]|uniref:Uncharacterized protein n=1 Tax=Westerdykella ornata TaxID=318751 RepID=A0A6A6J807_WESOR|nr:uncharacterized protein EI97DRAFT_462924 [Westerdykella ornata]KAF2271339.1 hypothetical protein EI97DRAFT_462924 [Westerdykella ornata]